MSQELATEILKELKFMHSKFDEYDNEFKFMHSKFDEYDNEFKFMHSKFDEYDNEFKFMHSKFDEYDEKFDEHNNELRNLSKSIAKLEVEHGQKIDTLIDITSSILERLDSLERNFKSNNEELDKHSDQIWNLESKAGII